MKKHSAIFFALLAAALYALNAPLSKLLLNDVQPSMMAIPALALGFVAYGLSIFFDVYAQRCLGAACTSACYAAAPFIGVLLSLIIFLQWPKALFFAALAIMIVATVLVSRDGAEAEAADA